ncbi:MAG: leucine-rich repeat protein [Clostridia bacterium]|nr:leucine-rich repeat protein [Clostridia bacterium]
MKRLIKYSALCFILVAVFCVCASAVANTGKCGDNVYYSFDASSGVLTISGEGAMYEYSVTLFDNAASLVEKVIIEDGVTTIGGNAFKGFHQLKIVIIKGNKLVKVCNSAFAECESLKSLVLPEGVEYIGNLAFSGCDNLSITLPHTITYFDEYAFGSYDLNAKENFFHKENGIIYLKTSTTPYYAIWKSKNKDADSIVLPEGIQYIRPSSFYMHTNLKKVTMPSTLRYIGDRAFQKCSALRVVTSSPALTYIGIDSFNSCISLATFKIPSTVYSIGEGAFSGCESMRTVNFEKNVAGLNIGDRAFELCKSLSSLEIPDGTNSIGYRAFYGCENLSNLTLSENIGYYGSECFHECPLVTNYINGVQYLKANGNNNFAVLDVPFNVFDYSGVISGSYNIAENYNVEPGTKVIISYAFESIECKSITVPDSVYYIGERAFSDSKKLERVHLPEALLYIEAYTFAGCTSLDELVIPESVTKINVYAFENCTSLEKIVIPRGVEEIGDYAFRNCTNLTDIKLPAVLWSIGENTFFGANKVFVDCCENTYPVEYCDEYGIPYSTYNGAIPNGKNIIMQIDSRYAHVYRAEPYENWIANDVSPLIINGRTMLPARFVAQNLGAAVEWDGVEKKNVITKNDLRITLYVNSTDAYVNGEKCTLDSPLTLLYNRTYAPVRFIAERLGATVKWYPDTREVEIIR